MLGERKEQLHHKSWIVLFKFLHLFLFRKKGVFCSYLLLASLSFSENLLAHRQLFSLEVAILAPFANCRKKQWEGEKCMVR